MAVAKNVIDLEDRNGDGVLDGEEFVEKYEDYIDLDEDEAEELEDVIDELEEDDKFIERMEEIGEDGIKSLIASIQDPDEQAEILDFMARNKMAFGFKDFTRMFKNKKRKYRQVSEDSWDREQGKKEKAALEKLTLKYRKEFFSTAYKGLAEFYKRNWDNAYDEIVHIFKEIFDVLSDAEKAVGKTKQTELKDKLSAFKTKHIAVEYSRVGLYNKKMVQTLNLLKQAKAAKHAPYRAIFKESLNKTSSLSDLYNRANKKYKGRETDLESGTETAEYDEENLNKLEETLTQMLKELQEALDAKRLNADLNTRLGDPLVNIADKYDDLSVKELQRSEGIPVTLDVLSVSARLNKLAIEILDIDKQLDSLLPLFQNTVMNSNYVLEEPMSSEDAQEIEDGTEHEEKEESAVPPASPTPEAPAPASDTTSAADEDVNTILNHIMDWSKHQDALETSLKTVKHLIEARLKNIGYTIDDFKFYISMQSPMSINEAIYKLEQQWDTLAQQEVGRDSSKVEAIYEIIGTQIENFYGLIERDLLKAQTDLNEEGVTFIEVVTHALETEEAEPDNTEEITPRDSDDPEKEPESGVSAEDEAEETTTEEKDQEDFSEEINKVLEELEGDAKTEAEQAIEEIKSLLTDDNSKYLPEYISLVEEIKTNPVTAAKIESLSKDLSYAEVLTFIENYEGRMPENEELISQYKLEISRYFSKGEVPILLNADLVEVKEKNKALIGFFPINSEEGMFFPLREYSENVKTLANLVTKLGRQNNITKVIEKFVRTLVAAAPKVKNSEINISDLKNHAANVREALNNIEPADSTSVKLLSREIKSSVNEVTASFRARKIALAYLYAHHG